MNRLIRQCKDWMDAEFPFSSFSHKLDTDKAYKLEKGEFHEHNRSCSHLSDPAHYSIWRIDRVRRVDTPPRSKLLAPQVRFYGNHNISARCHYGTTPATGAANCWNWHTHLLPPQTGCPLAGRGQTCAGIHPKSGMLEDQRLFARAAEELHCCIFPSAMLAGLSPSKWLFA